MENKDNHFSLWKLLFGRAYIMKTVTSCGTL